MEKNKKINAIIVDDEDGCITNLNYYITKLCPEISVIATGNTLKEALDKTESKKIDLAFLDVEIFDDNIFNLLSQHPGHKFKIVFVTAYQQYALKAIKVEALDYILKPLHDDDILDCYTKIQKHFFLTDTAHKQPEENPEEKKNRKIIIKNSDKIYVIKSDDIVYITGSGFYSEITFSFNNDFKTIVVSKPLNKLEEEYVYPFLFRIHKSHIVNINKISSLNKNDGLTLKMTNNEIILVAKRRANDFITYLNNSK